MDVLTARCRRKKEISPMALALLLAVVAAIPGGSDAAHNITVEQRIRDDPNLSKFYSLLQKNLYANSTLTMTQVTVFAPTNQAFQNYRNPVDNSIVLYHISNLAQTLDQLGSSVTTQLEGNPPLWITRQWNDGTEDIFINNAKVIRDRSNYQAINDLRKMQVLHVIDEVLEPVMTNDSNPPVYNPDAFQFLNQSESLKLEDHRARSFRQRVNFNNKDNIFKAEGRYTFFIPVDDGFKHPPAPAKIDAKVIDGHVIPNHVLFTRAVKKDHPYETLAFGDMLHVTVSFTLQDDGRQTNLYVKSNTMEGDGTHPTGVVLAEIFKANIPVKNGVVHLIQRPLMVVDTTVEEFLKSFQLIEKKDGPLNRFYDVISNYGNEFMEDIIKMKSLTLFAPSNSAWNNSNLDNILHNKEKIKEILNLHLVKERLSMEKIIENNMNQLFQVETAAERKHLYFNVITRGNNQTLTVEGGGVNATVIQPNVAATNGLVHIIDRVLGVPYTTVYEKLATDPMLNKTFHLGQQERFNEQLNNTNKRFTYFVPRDSAWEKAEIHSPSAHKKLFMKEFGYHVKQILERHLVVNSAYKMAELKEMTNKSAVLPTVRDVLKIQIKEIHKSYFLEWQGERIHVFRPDVECTNGVIHVIDSALLKESDVIVTGGSMPSSHAVTPFVLLAQLFTLLTVKFLL